MKYGPKLNLLGRGEYFWVYSCSESLRLKVDRFSSQEASGMRDMVLGL